MSNGPNDLYEKLMKAIKAWSMVRPNKVFAGYTLEGFKEAVSRSLKLRQDLTKIDAQRESLITARDDADVLSRKALRRLTHSVIADADEGEDGELYREMGYMPRSARNALQSASRSKAAENATTGSDKEVVG